MADITTPPRRQVGSVQGVTLFNADTPLICVKQMPLPGVVIFVHGVNSEGEWYKDAEAGLCKGLNRRLGRYHDQLMYHGTEAGQMTPVTYIDSLTADGFINPKMWSGTYIQPEASFSPVIHFRWGYKANKDELKTYGQDIFLNEQNYWGGGPFQNGCTSLPDIWNVGVNDRLFGWITLQHLNSSTRPLYSSPPRTYGALAALRLARLIETIRNKQADVPITLVCHSQGNMVGIAAAFIGDTRPPVTDPFGKTGRCVADAYVLSNPPYSLVGESVADTWSQRATADSKGNLGRETGAARVETLKNFFNIMRERAALEHDAAEIDAEMGNTRSSDSGGKPFSAASDRAAHGLKGSHTFGRVTLYSNPHDQVISVTTVQGIGWRGMSDQEVADTDGDGVLTQRVFASGFEVGKRPEAAGGSLIYACWADDWRGPRQAGNFWYPPSPPARFALLKAEQANASCIGHVSTALTAPLGYLYDMVTTFPGLKVPVNADPPQGWSVTITAPPLDQSFMPVALRYGAVSEVDDGVGHKSAFNEGYDPPALARDKTRAADPADPYSSYVSPATTGTDGHSAMPLGDEQSEAAQRYEDHADLRLEARRTDTAGWVDSK